MLRGLARLLLAFGALSPVAVTWVIADYGRRGYDRDQIVVIFCAAMLALVCFLVLTAAARQLTKVSFSIEEIRAVDSEVVAYVVTYLFPLVAPTETVNSLSLGFVFLLLAIVLSSAHAFTFNPLLTVLGYHFYEVKCSTGVSYLLISKGDISDVKQVDAVVRLSKFLVLDITRR